MLLYVFCNGMTKEVYATKCKKGINHQYIIFEDFFEINIESSAPLYRVTFSKNCILKDCFQILDQMNYVKKTKFIFVSPYIPNMW